MFKITNVVKQYIVIIVANFTVLNLGLGVTWPSPTLIKLRNATLTPLHRVVTDEEASWIVSITPLTGTLVIFVSGYLMDTFGRKTAVLVITLPRTTTYLLQLFANEVWMILVARALSGFADVLTLSVVSSYASEIASKEIRGALGTITQIMSALGMMITLTVGPYVGYFQLNLIILCIIIGVSVPLFFLPETPYYLYTKGRIDESLNTLILLRGSEIKAKEEIKEYSMNINVKANKIDVFKDRTVIKSLILVILLAVCFEITGSNAVSFYLQTIFQSTKTNISPEISSVVIGCTQLLGCFCTTLLTDRFGRKPILISSLTGMCLGLTGLGVFFNHLQNNGELTGFMNYLPLMSLILDIFCYNAGLASIIWMLAAELFDGPARAMGVTIGVVVAGAGSFLTSKYFETLTLTLGPAGTYWFFAFNCILAILFVSIFIPETKGRTFTEIQTALGRKIDKDLSEIK